MQAVTFIREGNILINDINEYKVVRITRSDEENRHIHDDLQRRVNMMFNGLQNPTLITAAKLREAAQSAGFHIDNRVLRRLDEAEEQWSQ